MRPADDGEQLELAALCRRPCKALYAAASRFYVEVFGRNPKLADELKLRHRYNAACAAALAGCGQDNDAKPPDNKERARLRHQALEWLRADVAAWGQLLAKDLQKVRSELAKTMQLWQHDKHFASVRGDALSKLPEAERHDWQRLWLEVEALRQRAAEPAQKAGS